MTKEKENHLLTIRSLREEIKEKDAYTDKIRKSFLAEIVHLREKVYTKTNLGLYKNDDIFRFEAFKVDDVLDKATVKLLNDKLELQRDFYLQK